MRALPESIELNAHFFLELKEMMSGASHYDEAGNLLLVLDPNLHVCFTGVLSGEAKVHRPKDLIHESSLYKERRAGVALVKVKCSSFSLLNICGPVEDHSLELVLIDGLND